MIGLTTTFGNQLVITALTLDKAGRVQSLTFLDIVLGYVEDVLLFNYALKTIEFVGAATIVVCSVATFVFKFLKISD